MVLGDFLRHNRQPVKEDAQMPIIRILIAEKT